MDKRQLAKCSDKKRLESSDEEAPGDPNAPDELGKPSDARSKKNRRLKPTEDYVKPPPKQNLVIQPVPENSVNTPAQPKNDDATGVISGSPEAGKSSTSSEKQ